MYNHSNDDSAPLNTGNDSDLPKLAQFLHTLNYRVLELAKDVKEVEADLKVLSDHKQQLNTLNIYTDSAKSSLREQGMRLGNHDKELTEIRTQLKIAWWVGGAAFVASITAILEVFIVAKQ